MACMADVSLEFPEREVFGSSHRAPKEEPLSYSVPLYRFRKPERGFGSTAMNLINQQITSEQTSVALGSCCWQVHRLPIPRPK